MRIVTSSPEHHAISHRVSQRVHFLSGISRPRIPMDSHAAEIVAEPRLHEAAGRSMERFAGRLQDIMNRW